MRIRILTRSGIVMLALSLASLGCKDQNNPLTGGSPSNVVFPTSNVSYANQVQPLFNQTCTLSGCHDDAAPEGIVKLTSWSHTVLDLPGVVVPGDPSKSELVFRIEGTVGQRMPPYGNPLNQNQTNGIRTWITEGAKNN